MPRSFRKSFNPFSSTVKRMSSKGVGSMATAMAVAMTFSAMSGKHPRRSSNKPRSDWTLSRTVTHPYFRTCSSSGSVFGSLGIICPVSGSTLPRYVLSVTGFFFPATRLDLLS